MCACFTLTCRLNLLVQKMAQLTLDEGAAGAAAVTVYWETW
jgi:hypothetical protein